MNDIHLYVDAFPSRVITLETEKALKKMLSLFQGASLRITCFIEASGYRLLQYCVLSLLSAGFVKAGVLQ